MTREEIEALLAPLLAAERRIQEGERELAEADRKVKEAKEKISAGIHTMRLFAREYMDPSLFEEKQPDPILL